MENWKVTFLDDSIVTGGDLGAVKYFDLNSKESTNKRNAGEVFITSLTASSNGNFLALGNTNGKLFIVN